MKQLLFLALILAYAIMLFTLFACSGINPQPPMNIEQFSLINTIPLGMQTDKILYHSQSNTLYAMSVKNQEIYIFQDGELKNVLGGLGSSKVNFQYLADMALGTDNSLYVLDSSTKSVKKFISDGKPSGSIELKGSVQPKCLCIFQEQEMFIFDSASGEIINYSGIDGTEQNRFGRFQLQQINSLSCNHDYLIAYDKDNNLSHIFSLLGQFVKDEPGQVVYDMFNNGICYNEGMLKCLNSPAYLPLTEDKVLIFIHNNILALHQGEEVRILKIVYSQVE